VDARGDHRLGHRLEGERHEDTQSGGTVQSTERLPVTPLSEQEPHEDEPEQAPGPESHEPCLGEHVQKHVVGVPSVPEEMRIRGRAIPGVGDVVVRPEADPHDRVIDDHLDGLSPDVLAQDDPPVAFGMQEGGHQGGRRRRAHDDHRDDQADDPDER